MQFFYTIKNLQLYKSKYSIERNRNEDNMFKMCAKYVLESWMEDLFLATFTFYQLVRDVKKILFKNRY